MRVGLIGFGSIGRRVAELLAAQSDADIQTCAVLVRTPARYADDAARLGISFTESFDDFLAADLEVVVELGGHGALAAYGEEILRRGLVLLTVSAGLLADDTFRERLFRTADEYGGRIVLPSGAIAGLDAIESARTVGLERVRHVVRKPPKSLFDDPERVAEVVARGAPLTLYEGPANEATRRFPENVNVVAMVSLAGLGFESTTAVVMADPAVDHNTHEVTAEGAFGRLYVKIENVPSPDNPKTGLIVAGSVARTLARLSGSVNVGG